MRILIQSSLHRICGDGAAVACGGVLLLGAVHAAPFLYAPGDLLLAVRQAGGASDYVVNLGKAVDFAAVKPGTSLVLSNVSAQQLSLGFPNLNGLHWSVAAANRPPAVPGYPLQTLWVSSPRLDPGVRGVSWLRKGAFVQGTAASQIDALGVNAAAASGSQPAGPENTGTGVIIPSNSGYAVGPVLGDGGNFAGTFQGVAEARTPDDFDTVPGGVSRADLFELVPGTSVEGTLNSPGRHLGYLEFKPDGTLTFNTVTVAPPEPRIVSITREQAVTTVSFNTVETARYQLRGTRVLGGAAGGWPVVAGPVAGTGRVVSLQSAGEGDAQFFVVEAVP